ncbi:MAG: orotate phosphoribosyltransferase [Peptococcaceae bacterium]|nr:orotate phosphoribosyltransferase [Peptococcaceae bacterium]
MEVLRSAGVELILRDSGALLEGHFLLTSGLHSARYIQCAQVLKYPRYAEQLGSSLATSLKKYEPDLVIGPALGGILVAHEVARALDKIGLFTERKDGQMTLRRGFTINPGAKIVVVEDVVTTGGSVKEVIEVARQCGGKVVAVGAIVDRSKGTVDFSVPFHALLTLDIPTYKPEECPLCRAGKPVVKPGSRT